ncbi:MAG: PpiC-type peptidyl-prolyl cis-trans isomerase [Spirochaetes bacterium]|nr:MAG: PpiC-type peptidyl-prolyl cis-trans isomerase [Spirochaetota bacterium]
MASQTKAPEGAETKKVGKKSQPKRGIKNPFIYGGTVVILVITVIAFVFIPSMGGGFISPTAPSFGSWDGKSITYGADSYFASQVAQINDYLRQQGLSEQNFQLYAYQVWNMAFQSTAIRMAIIDTVEDSGFKVTEKGLDEAMVNNESFFVDGSFSLEKYNSTPLSTRLSLRKTARDDLFVRRYYEDLFTIAPSTAEVGFVAAMAKPKRTIVYAAIPMADFPKDQVKAWAQNNADLFRSLGISRVTVTSSEDDAKKILQQVKENKLSFEDAAKSHSQDAYADKGGDAGTVFYYSFAQDFSDPTGAEKVANLPKGELSEVYKLGEGAWAFFKINAPLSSADLDKGSTLDEAMAYIQEREKGSLESWAIAKANEIISSSDPEAFKRNAAKAGYAIKNAGPFIINLGNPSFYAYNQQMSLLQLPYPTGSQELLAAESNEAFMTELFSLEKGKVSKPLVVDDAVVVFSIADDTPASDEDTSFVKFGYPYFHQESVDSQTRDTFLKSKKFKDEFSATFFKIFQAPQAKATSEKTQTEKETPSN